MTAPKNKRTAAKKTRRRPLSPPQAVPEEEEESSDSDVGAAPPHEQADDYQISEEDDDDEAAAEKGDESEDDDEEDEESDAVEVVGVPQKRKGPTKGNKKSFSFNLPLFQDSYCLFLIEKSAKATNLDEDEVEEPPRFLTPSRHLLLKN